MRLVSGLWRAVRAGGLALLLIVLYALTSAALVGIAPMLLTRVSHVAVSD
jgi:hypothetical protein